MIHDAFFSHSHSSKQTVEDIARYMEDAYALKIWLDRWKLVPGEKWIPEIEKSLNKSKSCIVFLGEKNSMGWFQEEMELALSIQSEKNGYRVVPVLLPNASDLPKSSFLNLRTAIDLRKNTNDEEELYRLYCGIVGKVPGRYMKKQNEIEHKLKNLKELYASNLIEKEVLVQLQVDILKDNGMI